MAERQFVLDPDLGHRGLVHLVVAVRVSASSASRVKQTNGD